MANNKTPIEYPKEQLLLEQIAIAGEYPYTNRQRIIPSSTYLRKILANLLNDKIIANVNKDGVKGYKLTARGKQRLMKDNPTRFEGLFTGEVETNRLRSTLVRRERIHLMAEIYTFMYNTGAKVYQDTKPKISELSLNNAETQIIIPYYYSSREQKGKESDAIRGSRATGVLLSQSCVFAVYNTGNVVRKWSEKKETQFKIRAKKDFATKITQYNKAEVAGIMIGADMDVLKKYLDYPATAGFGPMINAYDKLYYVTNDGIGEIQMRLLCDTWRMTALTKIMETGYFPIDSTFSIACDAKTEDGIPVLFCCLLDITKLIRFRNGLSMDRHNRNGKVICFDFQLDILNGYLGDRVEFIVINFNKLYKAYFSAGIR